MQECFVNNWHYIQGVFRAVEKVQFVSICCCCVMDKGRPSLFKTLRNLRTFDNKSHPNQATFKQIRCGKSNKNITSLSCRG